MPNRDCRIVADVPERWVVDLDEMAEQAGKSRAHIIRDAVREYIDHDRTARLESEVSDISAQLDRIEDALSDGSTHTHKHEVATGTSETVAKTREIAERLQNNHDERLMASDVDRAIKDIAGGDPRTLEKYRGELKEREHVYEHPNPEAPTWYLSRREYLDDLAQYAQQTGKPAAIVARELAEYDLEVSDVNDDIPLQL